MTNLTNLDLNTLTLKDLQTLAKEFQVKNWWKMKKVELISSLEGSRILQQKAQATAEKMAQTPATEDPNPEKKAPAKKDPKKATKVEKNEDNLITLKELAAEFHMKGTKARRLLRNETAARPFGGNRWEWDKDIHKAELEKARSILKAHTK